MGCRVSSRDTLASLDIDLRRNRLAFLQRSLDDVSVVQKDVAILLGIFDLEFSLRPDNEPGITNLPT